MRSGWARPMALVIWCLLALGGCGDDDDDGGRRGASQLLKDAVAETEAAGTARTNFEITISDGGGQSENFGGEGLVDFEHDRDLSTLEFGGRTLQLFNDRGQEYFREGESGPYRRFPESAQSPVANNPADSLKYLGTDVVDVRTADQDDCYEGSLDFKRIFARVEPGREAEFPEELRGTKAPVTVCVDGAGRIRRYNVDISIEDAVVKARTRLSDHGRAPALDPLAPEERPP